MLHTQIYVWEKQNFKKIIATTTTRIQTPLLCICIRLWEKDPCPGSTLYVLYLVGLWNWPFFPPRNKLKFIQVTFLPLFFTSFAYILLFLTELFPLLLNFPFTFPFIYPPPPNDITRYLRHSPIFQYIPLSPLPELETVLQNIQESCFIPKVGHH